MSRPLQVALLPELVDRSLLGDAVTVVVDILRATTTIISTLDAGATEVLPFNVPEDATAKADELRTSGFEPLLGGERHGLLIPGFDFDNSPRAYTEDVVKDRSVLFTTTNGTRALLQVADAPEVLLGAFSNLSAICDVLRSSSRPMIIVCAGTNRAISSEDILFAGAVVSRLRSDDVSLDDSALIAHRLYRSYGDDLLSGLRESYGGRNLIDLGLDADIVFAARVDRSEAVPRYDHATGRIR